MGLNLFCSVQSSLTFSSSLSSEKASGGPKDKKEDAKSGYCECCCVRFTDMKQVRALHYILLAEVPSVARVLIDLSVDAVYPILLL